MFQIGKIPLTNKMNIPDGLILDFFAGGGGASVGIEMALGRPVDIAVNHDPDAIKMHEANHPGTIHLTEDIFKVNLSKYVKNQHVALVWASPDCFPAGNLVWTDKGYKNIEDVRPFDKVLTHTGQYKTVTRFIKKNTAKLLKVKIAGCEEFLTTPNHPFYARKKCSKWIPETRQTLTGLEPAKWVKAEDLTKEYRVGIPINTKSIIPKWNGVAKTTANTYGINTAWIENTLSPYMDNKDFWWIVGRYFGDGCIARGKDIIDICCAHEKENEIRQVADRLGIPYTFRVKKTTSSFMYSNKEFCEFLRQFGIGSLNKSITPTILNLPVPLLRTFVDGYLSADGHLEKLKSGGERCSFTTVSKNLAYGMQQCLLKAYDRYASMYVDKNPNNVIEGRTVNVHKLYTLGFAKNESSRLQYSIEDGMAWVNVKDVSKAPCEQHSIYTLSVEEDESYTINNIAVHNCTSHSKAKGGQPRKSGLRVLPWAVFKHAKYLLPDVIIMENVEEIQQWGPLDDKGYPIKEKEGEDYKKFITAMKSLGYVFDSKELVAADFGAPTTRKRWYAIFRRDGKPITWPTQTHSKSGTDGLEPWVPVSKVLDFSNLGKSIFGRKKPLADKTMKRIAGGLKKFVLESDNPFIVPVGDITYNGDEKQFATKVTPFLDKAYGGNYQGFGSSVKLPISTITTVDHNRMITPFLVQYHSETQKDSVRGQVIDEPLRTIDTSNRYGLVMSFLTKFYKSGLGQTVREPIHTITTSAGHFGQVNILAVPKEDLEKTLEKLAMVDKLQMEQMMQKCTWVSQFIIEYYGQGIGSSLNDPMHTVVTKDRFALITVLGNEYCLVDIFLRMLTPEELKLGQGFPKDYMIEFMQENGRPYPKTKQVARIGNSVVPMMAQALVSANCPYLKVGERVPNLYINTDEPQLAFI